MTVDKEMIQELKPTKPYLNLAITIIIIFYYYVTVIVTVLVVCCPCYYLNFEILIVTILQV